MPFEGNRVIAPFQVHHVRTSTTSFPEFVFAFLFLFGQLSPSSGIHWFCYCSLFRKKIHRRRDFLVIALEKQEEKRGREGRENQAMDILDTPALAPPPGITPNFATPENLSYPEMAILQLVVTTLVVGLRLYTKGVILRKVMSEDCKSNEYMPKRKRMYMY